MFLFCHLAANLVHHPRKVDGVYGRLFHFVPSLKRLIHLPGKPAGVCGRLLHFLPSLKRLVHRPGKPAGVYGRPLPGAISAPRPCTCSALLGCGLTLFPFGWWRRKRAC